MNDEWTVTDILEEAKRKYNLEDVSHEKTQLANGQTIDDTNSLDSTYKRRITRALNNKGYGQKNGRKYKVNSAVARDLIDKDLKKYFIQHSKDNSGYKQDAELQKQVKNKIDNEINHYGLVTNNPNTPDYYNDALSENTLEKVISTISDDEYNPIPRLKATLNSDDTELGTILDNLESEIKNVKQEFIFRVLLTNNYKSKFKQKKFISDYIYLYTHLVDYAHGDPKPELGYTNYKKKLDDPLKYYFEDDKS